MTRTFAAVCLVCFGTQLFAQDWEPCESDELTASFEEHRILEYEDVGDDKFAAIITAPTELPKLELAGFFLIREEGDDRILHAPLVQMSENPQLKWTAVTLNKALAAGYTIVVTYHLVNPYPDGCWYEFRIPIDPREGE